MMQSLREELSEACARLESGWEHIVIWKIQTESPYFFWCKSSRY